MDEIKNAYRRLALKYNPKVSKDKDSERRFVEINEAYSHLSDEYKRRQYDQFTFGELLPSHAHSIFSDFFTDRDFISEADRKLFKPLIKQTDKMMKRMMRDPTLGWSGFNVPRLGWDSSMMPSNMLAPSRLWDSDISSRMWDVDLMRPSLMSSEMDI